MALAQFRGKAGGCVSSKSSQSLVSEINRNAEPRVFDKEALHLIHSPNMLPYVRGVDAFAVWTDAVQVLVDVCNAIFPDLSLPIGRGQLIL